MITKTVPNACLFTAGAIFREFVVQAPQARALFRVRYQEARIGSVEQAFLVSYPDVHNWIVVVADDSPDAVVVLPILQRMAEASPRVGLRIFVVDEDLPLWESFLDEESLDDNSSEIDTPLLLMLDEEYQLLGQWGPRSQAADLRLDEWLDAHAEFEELADDESNEGLLAYSQLLDRLTLEMRVWYNSGITQSTVEEIVSLMKKVQSVDDESESE